MGSQAIRKKWINLISSGSFGVYYPKALENLKKIGTIRRIVFSAKTSENEMIEALRDIDSLILGAMGYISKGIMEKADKLKVIAKHAVSVDNIDLEAATDRGVIVTFTPHTNTEAAAEHTFALILTLLRKVVWANDIVKKGAWRERSKSIAHELKSETLGLVGFGAVGRRVAELGRAFGMDVITYDPYVSGKIITETNVKKVNLETLFRNADVVSIHALLTKENYHMIGKREISVMKKNAILVNTARGGLLDEKALIKALRESWIAGVALDVMEKEPPELDNPLIGLDNVIITPHLGAYTYEALKNMDIMVVEDITKVYKGKRPLRVANPEVLPKIFCDK